MTGREKKARHVPPVRSDVVIEDPHPLVQGGRFFAKAVVGDPLVVSAEIFSHGHDVVRALLRHRKVGARRWSEEPMTSEGNDHFQATVTLLDAAPFDVEIAAERDELMSWARDARRRAEAKKIDPFDGELGSGLLATATKRLGGRATAAEVASLEGLARRLAGGVSLDLLDELMGAVVLSGRKTGPKEASRRLKVFAQRERAAFSSWYELFPRSQSPDPKRPGTLADVAARLDYVARLGFDVLYLPPIHPIGTTARKGKGNVTVARRGDVGSPWAIGSEEGGHTAIAAELGGFEDFEALLAAAAAVGIEVALDLAFQCSPDHPWVREHPDWFAHRPDGSIACAENPPKRYEDIYPLDFNTADWQGLWEALADVVSFWARKGVRIFRVDNPHTKPFEFWEWLMAETRRETPGLIFLAEAFTRPRVMHRLAEVGFDQSYTYFTWRDSKSELEQYFTELTSPPGVEYFWPNVWPNTPDILPKSLQSGGRASFIARLVLAGGLSANYGIYGPVFELGWDEPAGAGSEEYKDSEKYEVHHHDLDDPASIADVVARLNAARRAHPALQRNYGLVFHRSDNDQILCWSKRAGSGDRVIGVVNLDPYWEQSGFVELDGAGLGLSDGAKLAVTDLLSGERYHWSVGENFVRLDPTVLSAHLFSVEEAP